MSQKSDPKSKCCNAEFSVGGEFRQRIPLGFGFPDRSGKFKMEVIEIKGYTGFCMECGKDGRIEYSRKKKTITPRGINAKIKRARSGK